MSASDYETSEYTVTYTTATRSGTDRHLALINASAAYARGATGQGETITLVDTGIRLDHREFSGVGKARETTLIPGYNPNHAIRGHGTGTAAVAAARRHGALRGTVDMHGVAFDARINMIAIRLGSGSGYQPFDFADWHDMANADRFAAYLDRADRARSHILNFSFGRDGAIDLYDRALVRARTPLLAQTLAQAAIPDADKKIIVWAAGNSRNDMYMGNPVAAASPSWLAGLGTYFPELRGHVLAVVAVTQDGAITDFSNLCGIAKSFCLAAPGENIVTPLSTTTTAYRTYSGTSFAAPIVAGALALLRQHYRGMMGNTELVARLLATADKTGIYADSDMYGQGLLDLDAATAPMGTMSLGAGVDIHAPRHASDLSTLALAPAFGDALNRALRNREIAAFDELHAPFFLPLGTFLPASTHNAQGLSRRLDSLHQPLGGRLRRLPGGGWLQLAPTRPDATYGAAFSLTRTVADGELFLSHRSHPGLHFGLHQAGFGVPAAPGEERGLVAPWLALAQDGLLFGGERRLGAGAVRAAVFSGGAIRDEWRDADPSQAHGVLGEYQWQPDPGRSSASLSLGWLSEEARALGSRARGAFGGLDSHTWFGSSTGHWRFSAHWTGFAALHLGLTQPRLQYSGRLLQEISPFWSSSFSIGLTGREPWQRPGEHITLRLTQPQRVESGWARLRWARGRTRYGQLLLEDAQLSLAPSTRQLDLAAMYVRPLGAGTLRLEAVMSHRPGHAADAPTAMSALLHYTLEF